MVANASMAMLRKCGVDTISPVMACSTVIAGSNAGDHRQASSEQAHFRTFCPQDVGMGREQER
ncbi:MAG: hypothetical protein Tsb002_36220 [Wenzhouxiangellaceae bacterium]